MLIAITLLLIGCDSKNPVQQVSGFVIKYDETYNIKLDKCLDFDLTTDCLKKDRWSKNIKIEMKILHFHYCTKENDETAAWHELLQQSMEDKTTCSVTYLDNRADWRKRLFRKDKYKPIKITN